MTMPHLSLLHQRGVALLIVLWLSVLLTVVASGFAYNTRIASLATRHFVDDVIGREAAMAGLEMAVHQLQMPDPNQRPWADGRPYTLVFEQTELTVRIQDESGKLSINRATQPQLVALFTSVGLEEDAVLALADAILDFIDADDLVRIHGAEAADYTAAGLPHIPKNAPFIVLEELLQVYGINETLYKRIAPALTPYGTNRQPDWRLAPEAVLKMIPDTTNEFIEGYLQTRFDITSPTELLPTLPNGQQFSVYAGRGPIYSLSIDAKLPNNTITTLKAVVDINKAANNKAYELLEIR